MHQREDILQETVCRSDAGWDLHGFEQLLGFFLDCADDVIEPVISAQLLSNFVDKYFAEVIRKAEIVTDHDRHNK